MYYVAYRNTGPAFCDGYGPDDESILRGLLGPFVAADAVHDAQVEGRVYVRPADYVATCGDLSHVRIHDRRTDGRTGPLTA